MQLNTIVGSVLTAGFLVGLTTACVSERHKQAELSEHAKITQTDAERTALGRVSNGTVKEGELEKEDGKLVWSFDISTLGTDDITEVLVDALTGEVVSVDIESASDEANEKENEADDED